MVRKNTLRHTPRLSAFYQMNIITAIKAAIAAHGIDAQQVAGLTVIRRDELADVGGPGWEVLYSLNKSAPNSVDSKRVAVGKNGRAATLASRAP
jgi:hypothetical protein